MGARALALRAGVYALALIPFALLYGTRERALLVAPAAALVAGIAAWAILRLATNDQRRQVTGAAVIAFTVGQVTWALGYWSAHMLVGGVAMLVTLYVTCELTAHAFAGTLDRQAGREIGLTGALATLMILAAAQPWRM